MKWATIAGVALLVLLLARQSKAAAPQWDYVPGYQPGSGYYA